MAKRQKLRAKPKKKGGVVVSYATKNTITTPLIRWAVLFLIFLIPSCNGGWSVGGLQISPSDSLNTDFMIITDQDSVKHWYVRTTVDGGILVGDNWCHRHEEWETVEKK